MTKITKFIAITVAIIAPMSIASAEQIAGLTFDQKIVTFDSATPMTINSAFAISGLAAGDRLIGIDLRPANSMIYGVSQAGRVYTLTTAGMASLVSTLSVVPTGATFGIDFNPVPDRLRIISASDQNLRANITTGATAVDTAISRAGEPIDIVGTAYTNSLAGAPAPSTTRIFGIDSVTDTLVTSSAPNGGVYTTVGALGVGLTNANMVGFDISGRSKQAYVSIDSAFYGVDLATGATRFVDTVGAGPLIGFTVTSAVPEPQTWGMMLLGFGIVGSTMRRRKRAMIAA